MASPGSGTRRASASRTASGVRRVIGKPRLEPRGNEAGRWTIATSRLDRPGHNLWPCLRQGDERFERYGRRIENYRPPKGREEREALARAIGGDGFLLLDALDAPGAPAEAREVPVAATPRDPWRVHYAREGDARPRWRAGAELPPVGERLQSPYDPEGHYSTKRQMEWSGYKVHVTKTCDEDAAHLITDVTTRAAMEQKSRVHDPALKWRYRVRAGVEDTPLQGGRAFGMRRSRYIGLAKTGLQQACAGAAMNVPRAVSWVTGATRAKTRETRFAALGQAAWIRRQYLSYLPTEEAWSCGPGFTIWVRPAGLKAGRMLKKPQISSLLDSAVNGCPFLFSIVRSGAGRSHLTEVPT
jgi:hypothetical protein